MGHRDEDADKYQCFECECNATMGSIPTHQFDSGVKFVLNKGNRVGVLFVHYSSDPDKNPDLNPKWQRQEMASYYGRPTKWRQLYEIDFDGPAGPRIFPEFTEEDHVDLELKFLPEEPLLMCYDPGMRHSAVTFSQWDSKRRLRVLCEILGDNAHISQMFKWVHFILKHEFFHEMDLSKKEPTPEVLRALQSEGRLVCYGDPAMKQRSNQTGISDERWLRNFGWRPKYMTGFRVEEKIEKTRALLFPDAEGEVRLKLKNHGYVIPQSGKPRLMQAREKGGLLAGFIGGYHWAMDSKGNVKLPEKPDKNDYSHLMDTVTDLVHNTHKWEKEVKTGMPNVNLGKNDFTFTDEEKVIEGNDYSLFYELASFHNCGAQY